MVGVITSMPIRAEAISGQRRFSRWAHSVTPAVSRTFGRPSICEWSSHGMRSRQ